MSKGRLTPTVSKRTIQEPIEELINEARKLTINKTNPERLKYIDAKLDFFNWGITIKK